MVVFVAGGMGYIGSHAVVELLSEGHEVIIADNLSNSKITVLDRIFTITGKKPKFYQIDVCDFNSVNKIFSENKIDAVIHFAGKKAVGESVAIPLDYYKTNIDSAVTVMSAMKAHGCKCFVFSSSATVYGMPKSNPIKEDFPLSTPTSPYGKTKLFIEYIMKDLYVSDNSFSMIILRYFNPIGTHQSGLLGEEPSGTPNNLMPYITEVAAGKYDHLNVYGDDYNTKDGTGVRDYIHVIDLVKGHIRALKLATEAGVHVFNLGTGTGYSVIEIVKTFERVNNIKIPYVIAPRRPGDIDEYYADPTLARELLGWSAELDLDNMCETAWKFIKNVKG